MVFPVDDSGRAHGVGRGDRGMMVGGCGAGVHAEGDGDALCPYHDVHLGLLWPEAVVVRHGFGGHQAEESILDEGVVDGLFIARGEGKYAFGDAAVEEDAVDVERTVEALRDATTDDGAPCVTQVAAQDPVPYPCGVVRVLVDGVATYSGGKALRKVALQGLCKAYLAYLVVGHQRGHEGDVICCVVLVGA